MTSEGVDGWSATITVRSSRADLADWLSRALAPEARREVPRARAELRRTADGAAEIAVEARDSGAMRAALNTYLGWVELAVATARRAGRDAPDAPAVA